MVHVGLVVVGCWRDGLLGVTSRCIRMASIATGCVRLTVITTFTGVSVIPAPVWVATAVYGVPLIVVLFGMATGIFLDIVKMLISWLFPGIMGRMSSARLRSTPVWVGVVFPDGKIQ